MTDGQTTTADYELRTLKVSEIVLGPDNPRVIFPESADIKELADSIAASGVIEPVHVRRVGNDLHELIAGERRLMAAKVAGCDKVPAIDHGAIGDDEAFEITFLENFGRRELTVMEQSRAVARCMKKFGSAPAVAERLGKSIRWVEQRANIEKGLSDEWKKAIAGDLLLMAWPASHVALVSRFPRHTQDGCLHDFLYDDAVITLSEVEARLAAKVKLLSKAPWDLDAKLGMTAQKTPRCSKCARRSSVQPGLWDDPDVDAVKSDRCLDPECWQVKFDGWLKARLKELKDQYGKVICLATKQLFWPNSDNLRKAFGSYRDARDFNVLKKPGAGRTPALIVSGTGVGELRWVKAKVPSGTSDRAGGGSSIGSAASHPKPKKLKDRRAELDSKRWFKVLAEMRDLIDQATIDQITAHDRMLFLIAVAATLGAPKQWQRPAHMRMINDESCKGIVTRLDEYVLAETPDAGYRLAQEELWGMVKPKLIEVITYDGPITQVPKAKIADAKAFAGYLGIDIKALFAEQKKGIAEPKSWSKLNADGTPKAAAGKKKSSRKKEQKN